jgi:hypothetical protein
MTWVHYLLIAAFVGLAFIWPISFFGYQFYLGCTHVDDPAKH